MKKNILFAVFLSTVFLLVSCENGSTRIDLENHEELKKQFLFPAIVSGITRNSWDDATLIDPNCFLQYYVCLSELDVVTIDWTAVNRIPANAVESVVTRYFDITADRIQKSKYYHSEDNTYEIFGIGSAADYRVVAAEQVDMLLTLTFETFMGDEIGQQGKLTINLGEDGIYQYLSCSRTDQTVPEG